MQPMFRQVPPKLPRLSIQALVRPNWPKADRRIIAAGAAPDHDRVKTVRHGSIPADLPDYGAIQRTAP